MNPKDLVLSNCVGIEIKLYNGETVKQKCITNETDSNILRNKILSIKMCSDYKECEKPILDCCSCLNNGIWELKQ
jgi:hypothetical protein